MLEPSNNVEGSLTIAVYHDKSDHLATLGVSANASTDEIKQAYRRLVRQCHPDLHHGDPAANARLAMINHAYATLMAWKRETSARPQPVWTTHSYHGGYDTEYPAEITSDEARMGTVRTFRFHDAYGQPYAIHVQIPAGVQTGSIVRLEGVGGPSPDGRTRGNLLVRIKVLEILLAPALAKTGAGALFSPISAAKRRSPLNPLPAIR